jgi:hypothetical protein
MLDAATAQRMVPVQVARDQFMARLIQANVERGAVLLAGNSRSRQRPKGGRNQPQGFSALPL